jgi:hypothetical protein
MNQKEKISGKVMAAFFATDFTASHAGTHQERFDPATPEKSCSRQLARPETSVSENTVFSGLSQSR